MVAVELWRADRTGSTGDASRWEPAGPAERLTLVAVVDGALAGLCKRASVELRLPGGVVVACWHMLVHFSAVFLPSFL